MATTWESTKAEIILDVAGQEKQEKQTFNNLVQAATTDQLVTFGQTLASLADDDYQLDAVVSITRTRHTAQ